jgi:hypothetical protein
VRADDVTYRRARGPILLAGVGAVVLSAGLALLLLGLVLRVSTRHSQGSLTTGGVALAVAGVVFGVATLTLFAFGKARNDDRRRPRVTTSLIGVPAGPGGPGSPGFSGGPGFSGAPGGWPPGPVAPGPAAPAAFGAGPGYGASPGYGADPGYGAGPGYAAETGYGAGHGYGAGPSYGAGPGYGAGSGYDAGSGPAPGGGPRPPWPKPFAASGPAGPAQPQSQRRAAPLDPTSVYSPGGLVGPSGGVRDDTSRAPGHEFDTAAPVAPPTVDADYADYAEVVHEERPQSPRHQPPRDVPLMPVATPEAFVYRDTDNPDGSAGEGGPGGSAVHNAPRGPFEPLVKSADTDIDQPG